jgi:hypothetical protein
MATSGSTDFNVTRDQVIAGALRLCGALGQGETPTATQVSEAAEALNMLVKAWQADGMPLWVIKNYTLTLVSGTNTYTISPKLLKVIQAFNHNTQTNIDIPMRIVTRQEYNVLGNKTSTGNPIQVFSSPELTNTVIKVFPTPDSTSASQNQIVLVYQKQFDDLDSASDNLEFPNEWFEAVKYGLATRMAGEYGVSLDDRRQLLNEANMIKQEALSFGTEEGSFFFQADRKNW